MPMTAPLPPIRTPFFDDQQRVSWPWVQWFLQLENLRGQFANSYAQDTHANRLANYPATSYAKAAEFYETDRHVFYVSNGTSWIYQGGVYLAPAANRPTDLGSNDTGFSFIATDSGLMSTWNGIAFITPVAALPAIVDALTFILQLARGLKSALPTSLPIGEPFYCTDTNELYFGTGAGTHKAETDANSIQGISVNPQAPQNGQLLIYDSATAAYVPGDPIVSGTAADGATPIGSPVRVGGTGTDGKVHTLLTDPLGNLNLIALENQGIGVLLQNILLEMRATKAAILALDRTLSPQDFTAEQFQDQFIN